MKIIFFAISLTLLLLTACKDKEKSIYADACGVEPTTDSVLLDSTSAGYPFDSSSVHEPYSTVFIPNIFVPDPNNVRYINHRFNIWVGLGFWEVLSMKCLDEDGNVLYQKENYFPDAANFDEGWSGEKPDGTYYYGIFHYECAVKFLDGQTRTYHGTACSYECGDDGFPTERLPDCFFPSNNNGNGGLDPNLPKETSCFQ